MENVRDGGKSLNEQREVGAVPASGKETTANTGHHAIIKKPVGSLAHLPEPIVWVDLEMTGLDLDKDQIIEIAIVVTDGSCERSVNGYSLVIHADDFLLDNMSKWCKETHGRSGLTEASRKSKLTLQEAELKVLDFVQKHVADLKTAPLAGNSVHIDRQFLLKQMPTFMNCLSYRIVDVSTVKELARRWKPSLPLFQKRFAHRGEDDIHESIREVLYYKRNFFALDAATYPYDNNY